MKIYICLKLSQKIKETHVMGLIDNYRGTLELTKIEKRLQALENAH